MLSLVFISLVLAQFHGSSCKWPTNTTIPAYSCFVTECNCAMCNKVNVSHEFSFCIHYVENSTTWQCPPRNQTVYNQCVENEKNWVQENKIVTIVFFSLLPALFIGVGIIFLIKYCRRNRNYQVLQ